MFQKHIKGVMLISLRTFSFCGLFPMKLRKKETNFPLRFQTGIWPEDSWNPESCEEYNLNLDTLDSLAIQRGAK